jgi:hypothetical protein
MGCIGYMSYKVEVCRVRVAYCVFREEKEMKMKVNIVSEREVMA